MPASTVIRDVTKDLIFQPISILKTALIDVQRIVGYKLVAALDPNLVRWMRVRSVLRDLLTKLSINCVLDVGANRGQYGAILRGLGYRGWILSFEPIRANLDILEKVAARNGPWRVFPYALGSTNSQLLINVTELSVFSSFLTPLEDSQTRFPKNRVERTEEVAVWRLDSVLKTCISGIPSPRIYLKMDTQGFDLEVLKGAEGVMPDVLALQTEISFKNIYEGMPSFTESIMQCGAYGFEVVDFLPVTSDSDALRAVEMDCVMARKAIL